MVRRLKEIIMRESRKCLAANNREMQAKLDGYEHQSRKSLNEHIKLVSDRNADLVRTIKTQEQKIKELTAV